MPLLRKLLRMLLVLVTSMFAGWLVIAGRSRPDSVREISSEMPPPLPPGRVVYVPERGEIFVRELGPPYPDAPTVVLVHGWMFPGDLHWFRTFEALAPHARVIAPDNRGHGRGSRPSRPFRLTDVADDVAALLRQLDATPAIAIGYSMGGQVAQLLWQRHPDVVQGLVLCATTDVYNVSARERWVWRGTGALQIILRLAPRHVVERLLLAQAEGRLPIRISRMITPETPREVIDRLPWMAGEFNRGSAEDIAEALREMGRFDARGWVGTIDVPTAVLVTTQDVLVPPARQRALAGRILGASLQELPLDHDGIVAHPEIFLPALEKAFTWVQGKT